MTTSGTIGRTTIDAVSVIEHAARRCGVLTSAIPAEVLLSARQNLFMILTEFLNKGLQLFCLQKTVYPLLSGQKTLSLDVGTTDLQDVLLRTAVNNAATASGAGFATYVPASAVMVYSVAFTVSAAGTYTFVLEASNDGVTWQTAGTRSVNPTGAATVAFDADLLTLTAAQWRLRETVAGMLIPLSVVFYTQATEIQMTALNRDDYALMPNKGFQSLQPLQFWYDKQYNQPRLWFWPTPQDSTRCAVVWAQFQIQDVGALSNTLQVPDRWLNAVISQLAPYVCLELPKELVPQDRYPILVERAETALLAAQEAEVDGSPLRLRPQIGGYTR